MKREQIKEKTKVRTLQKVSSNADAGTTGEVFNVGRKRFTVIWGWPPDPSKNTMGSMPADTFEFTPTDLSLLELVEPEDKPPSLDPQ
tara:strand:- start:16760 stop:17020 length:261 start_codon:yes stop_codon:yes gene_type:complete